MEEISTGASTPVCEPQATPAHPEMLVYKSKRNRDRLLRGLHRISSSPSLTGLRRTRSTSNPYPSKGTISCVSLAGTGPPLSARSGTPLPSPLGFPTSSSSVLGTPTTEFPFHDYFDEQQLPIRKIETGAPTSAPSTALLPADLKLTRPDGLARVKSATIVQQGPPFQFWEKTPHEVRVHILSYLDPKELVYASRVSRSFYKYCFDGQLWTTFDASQFYYQIPVESLTKIILATAPFIRDLNLRGCIQVEHYKRADSIVKACRNLQNATLEGCRNFKKSSLCNLLQANEGLMYLNLTGLPAVSNSTCKTIAESCPQLRTLDISWCSKVESKAIRAVIDGCPKLTDLRAGEVRGFDDIALAETIFKTNNLERLVLSGCTELSDEALTVMMQGVDPEIDILTDRPVVTPRKLRHLDLGRCTRLTDTGIRSLGYVTPNLQGLQLNRCKTLTNDALKPVLASCPGLTHLDLEELGELTNSVFSEELVNAPCAPTLQHLSLSYCEKIGDVGILPVVKKCVALRHIQLDNTRISDLVLAEASSMVHDREVRSTQYGLAPEVTLKMAVYDCQNVTWTGIREVLYRNTESKLEAGETTYPTQFVSLKCFYGFQMTVDEHQKRVLKGNFISAARLERKWADYMQATEEATMGGSGGRRRRRRVREAQAALDHDDGGLRRTRARTMGSCFVM